MVDFNKLRASKAQPNITAPVEIFRRLPKPPEINDLYQSQAHVLQEWYARRNERDIVIKLHTGGGKTLVALLIAQSVLKENREPVIYLSPTVQLVEQTLIKAGEYSIPAVSYERGQPLPKAFLAGRSVLVSTYQALFNGRSRFGLRGASNREQISAGAIILDDAHVAYAAVRNAFTLRVSKEDHGEDYAHLTSIFRNDFRELGRVGTFDDIISGREHGVLEVPYWNWKAKSERVSEYLRERAGDYPFEWPLVRDAFDYSHCLIGDKAFVITPMFPLVDLIPTFAQCPRRIFMSATIGDDSAIVRTFDADAESISKPIASDSLAGVSERMILIPELMPFRFDDARERIKKLGKWMVDNRNAGTVVLVPSAAAAKNWTDIAAFPDTTDKVAASVKELQSGLTRGPVVFANRYDGIDLPNDACRLLIIEGLPRGSNEYDLYRATAFLGGAELQGALAQRIEQGIGRGARGSGDYCVVVIIGRDLAAWLDRPANLKLLTSSTRAQLIIGNELGGAITDIKELGNTVIRCLNRDRDWVGYHADMLAEYVQTDEVDKGQLAQAAVERKAFQLLRDGYYEKTITKLEKYCQVTSDLDMKSRGWLQQLAARAAYYWGNEIVAQRLQQNAFRDNDNLLRPRTAPPYTRLVIPVKQAEAIVNRIAEYGSPRGLMLDFEEAVSHFVPESSANVFEQALSDLGRMLGFVTERPDRSYGVGPDVLWLLDERNALIIEAKSRKNRSNALTKEQHGQLLNAVEWFRREYTHMRAIRVSVHPNVQITRSTVVNETKALTYDKLNELVSDARYFLNAVCESPLAHDELVIRCTQLLEASKLTPDLLPEYYLVPFDAPLTGN